MPPPESTRMRGQYDDGGDNSRGKVQNVVTDSSVGDERPSANYFAEVDKGPHAGQPDRFDAMIAGGFPRKSEIWQAIQDYLSSDDPALVWCQSTYLSRMDKRAYVDDLRAKEVFLRETLHPKSDALGIPSQIFFGTPIGHDFDYVYLRYIIAFLDPFMQ